MRYTFICLISCLIAPSAFGLSVTDGVLGQFVTTQTVNVDIIVNDTVAAITPDRIVIAAIENNSPPATPAAGEIPATKAPTASSSGGSIASQSPAVPTPQTETIHEQSEPTHTVAPRAISIGVPPKPTIDLPPLIETVRQLIGDVSTTALPLSRMVEKWMPKQEAITPIATIAEPQKDSKLVTAITDIRDTRQQAAFHASALDPPISTIETRGYTLIGLILALGLICGMIIDRFITHIHSHKK